MTIVHLVYPHGPGLAAPHVIGRRLAEHLARSYSVRLHDWVGTTAIQPGPGDVLLGHPHPMPGTTFRRSFRREGWARRFVLSPFNGDRRQVAFLDPFVRAADAYLAITGRYWAREVHRTTFAHWAPSMVQLDLALNREDFPTLIRSFAPPGRRRILYVGHSGWQKNVGYLSAIARACPEWEFGWIGSGRPSDIPGVVAHGIRDTGTAETRELVSTYDFFLTVGQADANPMTVLEAMSWGLIPFCTPQSGYIEEPGVVNVPLNDVPGAVAVLRRWQEAANSELAQAQDANAARLAEHYTWERFGEEVRRALEDEPRQCAPASRCGRLALATAATISPSGPLGPQGRRLALASLRTRLGRN